MFPDDPVVEYDYIHDWLPYESEKIGTIYMNCDVNKLVVNG